MDTLVVVRGNTIRLTAEFRNWEREPADPISVTFRVLNTRMQEVFTRVLTVSDRSELGKYFVDYTPLANGSFIWEFEGMLDGTPSTERGRMEVRDIV